jgi:hypothetical protein
MSLLTASLFIFSDMYNPKKPIGIVIRLNTTNASHGFESLNVFQHQAQVTG